jgi:hypothetical protein
MRKRDIAIQSKFPLDAWIQNPDVQERFQTIVRAPSGLVMEVAAEFDLQSMVLLRAIFWMRERIMRVSSKTPRKRQGLVADMRALGWGLLVHEPEKLVVCGAACQPWSGEVKFVPIAPNDFQDYAEPFQVKIAWTLEAESLGPARTRFSHETRVVSTDDAARKRFRRYWRWARYGIISIRWILLPAIRRAAERRWAVEKRNQRCERQDTIRSNSE